MPDNEVRNLRSPLYGGRNVFFRKAQCFSPDLLINIAMDWLSDMAVTWLLGLKMAF